MRRSPQKQAEVFAAEQVVELGDRPQSAVTDLVEGIRKVHHEIAE